MTGAAMGMLRVRSIKNQDLPAVASSRRRRSVERRRWPRRRRRMERGVKDELEIRSLIENYADAVNRRDGAAIAALWAEDGRWSVPEVEVLADVRGAQNIRATWEALMAAIPKAFFICMPAGIRVDGDEATARSYGTELVTDGEGATRYGCGFYADRFRRQDGRWRFTERVWTTIDRVLIPS